MIVFNIGDLVSYKDEIGIIVDILKERRQLKIKWQLYNSPTGLFNQTFSGFKKCIKEKTYKHFPIKKI